VFTPTGGFGMNTGVDDAVNLAWKIAAMVSGWGGPNLLSSYEAERRPIAFRNTGMAKELLARHGQDTSMMICCMTPRETCRVPVLQAA
jgi:2-polyprenyl-6-methoxyphenol hydroxylase-like FAD-dependent oxidoreductase